MTKVKFGQSLKAFSQRRPFKPFVVELARGSGFTVEHPEALAHRGPVAVYIGVDGSYTLFDNTLITQVTEAKISGSKRSRRQA